MWDGVWILVDNVDLAELPVDWLFCARELEEELEVSSAKLLDGHCVGIEGDGRVINKRSPLVDFLADFLDAIDFLVDLLNAADGRESASVDAWLAGERSTFIA